MFDASGRGRLMPGRMSCTSGAWRQSTSQIAIFGTILKKRSVLQLYEYTDLLFTGHQEGGLLARVVDVVGWLVDAAVPLTCNTVVQHDGCNEHTAQITMNATMIEFVDTKV